MKLILVLGTILGSCLGPCAPQSQQPPGALQSRDRPPAPNCTTAEDCKRYPPPPAGCDGTWACGAHNLCEYRCPPGFQPHFDGQGGPGGPAAPTAPTQKPPGAGPLPMGNPPTPFQVHPPTGLPTGPSGPP